MIGQMEVTEITLQSISPDEEARRQSHALIAEALGVAPVAQPCTADAA